MKKLKLNIYWDDVYKMCINHNWFDKATNNDYDNFAFNIKFVNLFDIHFTTIDCLAEMIKHYSSTDESIEEIRQSLETIIKVSEREV